MIAGIRAASAVLFFLTWLPTTSATTYVVSGAPGPGVDFTDISSAVLASQPGDVIRVHIGIYGPFVVDRGVSVIGDQGVVILGPPAGATILVSSIPAGQRVVLSNFTTHQTSLEVQTCSGPVLIESVSGGALDSHSICPVHVMNCTDVRMRACTQVSVITNSSRLEITGSQLSGTPGLDGCMPSGLACGCCGAPQYGESGTTALVCQGNGDVHIGASSILGGRGGDTYNPTVCPGHAGGNGGDAVRVYGGSVLITGTGVEHVTGGQAGDGDSPCPSTPVASPGYAVHRFGGVVLYSGVVMGFVDTGVTHVVPADPCLLTYGNGAPGTQVLFIVVGQPGDEARLRVGRRMVVEDLPFVFEDRLTVPLRSYQLGLLPPSGRATFTLTMPVTLPAGTVLVAQGSTSDSTETRLTQSASIAIH